MTAAVRNQLLAAGAKIPKEATSVPQVQRTPAPKGKTQPPAPEPGKSKEKEPVEKHVQLPPKPAECGPWAIGHWTARRSVAYEPDSRVMLVGPADEFEQLLAHLQQFKP